MPPPGLKPFQLLEINVISAQDLEPVSRKMKTYATAWVNPRRKLSSRVDSGGDVNPTWNDKFVFRVDEEFLSQDTSAVQIEIYSVHWFKDSLVGSVRVLVGNLIPPILRSRQNHQIGMRFVALQVRRPSGRPQGILNIGVTVLDSSMRSMPLYTQPATSAVGYHDFMGDEDSYQHHHNNYHHQHHPNTAATQPLKPILRRSRSERSEFVTLDDAKSACGGSVVGVPIGGKKSAALEKDNSIISISNEPFKGFHKKGKASSVISGAELRDKKTDRKSKGRRGGKASSVISDSIVSKGSSFARTTAVKPDATATTAATKDIARGGGKDLGNKNKEKTPERSPNANNNKSTTTADDHEPTPPLREPPKMAIGKPLKLNGAGKYVVGAPHKASSIWSDSEVGPSPSEVAAAMAERRYPLEEERSSVLDGWSLDESVEGLRSKLERWRTELPPLYDRGYASSSFRSTGQHKRRHTEGSTTGMFSCFGNIYGYECQCICGKPPEKKRGNGKYKSPSSSIGSQSFL